MKGKQIAAVLCECFCLTIGLTGCTGRQDPVIFETKSNESYLSIYYEGREYVPYCPGGAGNRGAYLGYLEGDEAEEVYEYRGYPVTDWLVNYLDVPGGEALIFKEVHVTEIPEGLSSEYEWNE